MTNAITMKMREMINENSVWAIFALVRNNKTKGITNRENKEKKNVSFK